MEKGKFFSGLFIMAGLVFLGLMLPKAVSDFRSFDRIVTVKGLCEKEVPADKVIWPIVFKVVGNDISTVYSEISRKTAAVREFLTEGGISEDEITVSVPAVSDKYAQEYGNNDRTFRFLSTNIVTVCTGNVDKALELMNRQTDLLKKGIVTGGENAWNYPIEFKFEGLNGIKPSMIEEATRNAREAADKFAKDSGSRLGKIKTANQGTFTIENRDSNTPYIKTVRVVTSVTYYLRK